MIRPVDRDDYYSQGIDIGIEETDEDSDLDIYKSAVRKKVLIWVELYRRVRGWRPSTSISGLALSSIYSAPTGVHSPCSWSVDAAEIREERDFKLCMYSEMFEHGCYVRNFDKCDRLREYQPRPMIRLYMYIPKYIAPNTD